MIGRALVFSAVLAAGAAASAQDLPDPLPARPWQSGGLSLEVQPLLHDQTRAFFLGRGFDQASAERIAREGCVFRSSIGNAFGKADAPPVGVDLGDWKTVSPLGTIPVKRRVDWDRDWDAAGASTAAKVAFRWALAPDAQTYEPTDYNWGMITFALPPGTRFDLHLRWREGTSEKTGIIDNLECAHDGT